MVTGFAFERLENIVGEGENAGCQQFLLFSQCLHESSFLGGENQRLLVMVIDLICF